MTGATHLTATYTKTAGDASNTCSGASTVSPSGAWRTGRLSTRHDLDWYKFSLTSTGDGPDHPREPAGGRQPEPVQRLLEAADDLGPRRDHHRGDLPDPRQGQLRGQGHDQGHALDSDSYSLNIRRLPSGLALISGSARVDGSSLITVGEVYNGTSASQGRR